MRTHREDLHGNLLSNAALPSESGQAGRCRFSCAGILALVPEFGGGSPSHLCGTLNPVSATLRNWSMDLVNRYQTLRVLVALVVVSPLCSQNSKRAQQNSEPTKSDYIKGPHGYEGWTLNSPVADSGYGDQKLPLTLVVARNGHILRRISGDGFVWNWIFWADGRQVAYESGPLHFGLACVLYDLKKGRELSRVDCYHDLPPDSPDWVRALESATRK